MSLEMESKSSEVSNWPTGAKRYVHLAIACFQCLSCGGIIFGWFSTCASIMSISLMVYLMWQGHLYSRWLSMMEFMMNIARLVSKRNIRLHLVFTIASSSNMCANLFLGIIFDRYGPRLCKSISMLMLIAGSVCVALAHSRRENMDFDLFLPGMALLGFGGTGVQLASIHLSNLFPNMKSAISCLVVGSFQLSFIVFVIFNSISTSFGVSRRNIFLYFNVILVLNLILTLIFNPSKPYQLGVPGHPKSKSHHKGVIRLPSVFKKGGENLLAKTPPTVLRKHHSEEAPLLHNQDLKHRSFKTKIFSAPFLHLLIFFSIGTLWANFLVGNISTLLRNKKNASQDYDLLLSYFNIIMPMGVIFIPFIGCTIERFGYACVTYGAAIISLLYTLLLRFDSFILLVIAFTIYSLYRTMLFALVFAYLGHIFGFRHFGVLSGILFSIAAAVGFLQTPLSGIESQTTISILQAASFLLTFSLPVYESIKRKD